MRPDDGARGSKLCAVSVDLDEIPFYHQIHGLSAPEQASSHLVFDLALLRLEDFARSFGLPFTLFVIGSTPQRGENVTKLRAPPSAGHELGNQTARAKHELQRLRARQQKDED